MRGVAKAKTWQSRYYITIIKIAMASMKPRNDVKILRIMNGRYFLGMIAAMLMVSCGGGGQADGPEAVVTAFSKAMAAGQWDEAYGLCDTLTMKEYISANRQAWEYLEKTDSNAMKIAAQLMSDACVNVLNIEKADGGKRVHYAIEIEGMRKERKAVVRKNEEGAWKVTAITDAN